MPITPYTSPVHFEYRPLNLNAFVEPLSKMQEQFDLMQATVDATDFDLTHLPYGTDPERAKELKRIITEKRDELSKNLMETKNYKQAAVKLKELNTLWNKDPEKVALESNYKHWLERDKAERERIDNGKDNAITRDQYNQWVNEERARYKENKGASFTANYNNPGGTYNRITGDVGRLADQSDNLEKARLEVAKMQPEQKVTYFSQNIPSMTESERVSLETAVSSIDPNEVARETERYLRRIPKFQAWGEEVAKYNYLDDTARGKEIGPLAESLLTDANTLIDNEIARNLKRDPKFKSTEDYKALMNRKEEHQDMMSSGEYNPDYIKHLYTQNHLNKMYNSQDVGEIVGYKRIDKTHNIRKNYEWEKANSGSGDDLGGLFGGGFNPNTYENLNIDSLGKQQKTLAGQLRPSIGEINNIAGGQMRTLVNGWKGSDFRKNTENNPILMRERQETILRLAQTSKNAVEFQKNLWNAGIREGNNATISKSVWTALQNKDTYAYAVNEIEGSRHIYNDYQDSKALIKNINKAALNDKKYLEKVNDIADKYHYISNDRLFAIANKMGIDTKNYSKLNNKDLYEIKEKLKNKGIILNNNPNVSRGSEKTIATFTLSLNELAKIRGFKNLEDALKKGQTFNDYPLLNYELEKAQQELIDNKTLNPEAMTFRYTGDPKFDKALTSAFTNASDMIKFNPVGKTDWNNLPGFDEDGQVKAGTKLLDNQNVRLNASGNRMILEIPYEYLDASGNRQQATQFVDFKSGTQAQQRRILNTLTQRNTMGDDYNDQTHAMIQRLAYDVENPNSLTQNTFDAATVTKYSKRAVLGTAPLIDNGMTQPGVEYKIVKQHVNDDIPGKIVIIVSDASGRETILSNPVTGKPYDVDDVNGAKAIIATRNGWYNKIQ